MSRLMNKLTARAVVTAKVGRHGDGGGLYLVVSNTGARKWVYRFTWKANVTEMGLGSAATVSLAEARELALDARRAVAANLNPIVERNKKTASEIKAEAAKVTFGAVADRLVAAKSPEWRSDKHRQQWAMTLKVYVANLRERPIEDLDVSDVLTVLKPIWTKKAETASRLRGRLERVFDAALAQGFLPAGQANPARWRGHLEHLLPRRQKLTRGHHAALPFQDLPDFVKKLRERPSMAGLALEFLILTAARSSEVLNAQWSEMNDDLTIWCVPATRMKAGREHRVPLSPRAKEILQHVKAAQTGQFVFGAQPGAKRRGALKGASKDKPLSSMSMAMLLRRMDLPVTVHGFRSTFRDWVGEATNFPSELAEAALAHVVGDATERAYRRGDALDRRRTLMDAWEAFIRGETSPQILEG